MTANKIALETPYCKFTFVHLPKQVKKLSDLPNWFITLADKNTQQPTKVYLQIEHYPELGGPHDAADIGSNVVDYIVALLKDKNFIAQFGELCLNNWMQKAPTESENYRVSMQLLNFFQRRGRNTKSAIDASAEYRHQYTGTRTKKINPITLSLDSDVVFKTTQSHACFKRNYKCISGTVTILGQIHHFELTHPLFDLSLMMTGGDARRQITAGLKKAFPFISGESAIYGWTFDNQVQGK